MRALLRWKNVALNKPIPALGKDETLKTDSLKEEVRT